MQESKKRQGTKRNGNSAALKPSQDREPDDDIKTTEESIINRANDSSNYNLEDK